MKRYLNSSKMQVLRIFVGLCISIFFLGAPSMAHAASLYFGPASGSYGVGEQFSVNVFVSSGAAELNAVKGTVVVSNSNVELVSISQAGSIIDFWADGPTVVNGSTAHFEGVILGGGYSGSAGNVATLIFRARSAGDVVLNFNNGLVLANDGNGTELPTVTNGARFSIVTALRGQLIIPEGFTFENDLTFGDKNDETLYLQRCLLREGFFSDEATGYFGQRTEQAVSALQKEYTIDETGVVDEQTRPVLNEICFAAPSEGVSGPVEQATTTGPVQAPFYSSIEFWIGVSVSLALVIVILLIVIIILLTRRLPQHVEHRHRQITQKEATSLRQMHRRLSTTKTKIENDLRKIEDRLQKIEPGKHIKTRRVSGITKKEEN